MRTYPINIPSPRQRHILLIALLIGITIIRFNHKLGDAYTAKLYPFIGRMLTTLSNPIPFSIDGLFIALCLTGLIIYPIYAIAHQKKKKRTTLLHIAEFLLWIYAWFYCAWGLNYAQSNIFQRMKMPPTIPNKATFRNFAYRYADSLNATFTQNLPHQNETMAYIQQGYQQLNSTKMGINHPFNPHPRPKTMLFSPLSSMAGITGSMGPFFGEFTINAAVRPHNFPATCAHEYAHSLGIANEGEANFYSYIICTNTTNKAIRFSGYYQIFFHMLQQVDDLLGTSEYQTFLNHIRPEIIQLAKSDQHYWLSRRSPIIDTTQRFIYNLYLQSNHVDGGVKSYSAVIAIIMAWEAQQQRTRKHIFPNNNTPRTLSNAPFHRQP